VNNLWSVEKIDDEAFLLTPNNQRVAKMTLARAKGIAAALNTPEGRSAFEKGRLESDLQKEKQCLPLAPNPFDVFPEAACTDQPRKELWSQRKMLNRHDSFFSKEVCRSCSVRDDCLELALKFPESRDPGGTRGGLSLRERTRIRRARRLKLIKINAN